MKYLLLLTVLLVGCSNPPPLVAVGTTMATTQTGCHYKNKKEVTHAINQCLRTNNVLSRCTYEMQKVYCEQANYLVIKEYKARSKGKYYWNVIFKKKVDE